MLGANRSSRRTRIPPALRAAGVAALAVLGLVGCNDSEPRGLVRLVDEVDRSVIAESPLLEPASPGPPEGTSVWASDFEGDPLARLGWPDFGRGRGGAWVDQDSRHGQVLCVGADGSEQFSVLIRAKPLTRYRVTREVRTEWPDFDLRLVESSKRSPERDSSSARVDRSVFAKGVLLAVHRFEPPATEGWSRGRIEFVTGLETRTLALGFERVGDASRPLVASACLAELTVERLDADPRQDLELLRGSWRRSPRAGEDLGLVKRGRLLPLRRLRASRPPYDENYGVRDALFAPAPTRLRFPLTLPTDSRLTFSYGLSAGSQIGDEVEFEVFLEHRRERRSLFRSAVSIGREGRGWHWHEASVDLAPWGGEEVTLELRTSSTTPRGFGLWGDPVVGAPRPVGDPPNLVLIGIDTLRADRLSAYGHDRPTSPHLDRLAAEGILFARAISASNWTAPSFGSIFTGLTPASHGVVNEEFRMNDAVRTLAEHLRDGGWRTHAVVYKAAMFGLGLDQGFDRWLNLPTSNRIAQTNLDKALEVIAREGDRRFFLFLHLDDPHQPFNQPPPFDRRFSDAALRSRLEFELPLSIRNSKMDGCEGCLENGRPTEAFVHEAQALYDAAVAYTDDRLGVLFEVLRERGLWDDTVIAVVADHGEAIYDRYGLWGHGALLLADEMVHVPLILKPEAGAAATGVVVDAQVRTTDLLPTLLEALGLPAWEGHDARSLWPLVETGGEDRVAYFENPQRRVVGLRTGEWKYVVRALGGRAYSRLFDLAADPAEEVNLAGMRPRVVERLDEMLASFLLRTREGPFLLVVVDGEPGEYRLTIEGSEPRGWRPMIGLEPRAGSVGRDSAFSGGGRVLSLTQLDLEPGRRVVARLTSGERVLQEVETLGEDLALYDPGAFERLMAAPGVYFLRGPAQIGATRIGRPTHVDQVEDLRALGYIE